MSNHPVVHLLWNYFPFTMLLWNPFREFINAPLFIPRFLLFPSELLWNFAPESAMILASNGIAIYYVKTMGDEGRCNEQIENCNDYVQPNGDKMYGIIWGLLIADVVLYSTYD